MQVLVDRFDGRRFAKVDAYSIPKDGFTVQDLADPDGSIDVVEGSDYTAE